MLGHLSNVLYLSENVPTSFSVFKLIKLRYIPNKSKSFSLSCSMQYALRKVKDGINKLAPGVLFVTQDNKCLISVKWRPEPGNSRPVIFPVKKKKHLMEIDTNN